MNKETYRMIVVTFSLILFGVGSVSGQQAERIVSPMDSEDYMRMKMVQAEAAVSAEFYRSEAARYNAANGDAAALIGMRAIDALDTNKRSPTNSNDVAISDNQASVAKHQVWSGVVTGGLKTVGGIVLGKAGIDAVQSLGTAALSSAGNRTTTNISNDNGSSLDGVFGEGNTTSEVLVDGGSTLQGAIGEGNNFEYTEQVAPFSGVSVPDGLSFSEVNSSVGTIDSSGLPADRITDGVACVVAGGVFDSAQLRCSDGEGGTL